MSQSSVHYLCEYYYIHGLFSEDGDKGERGEKEGEREASAMRERDGDSKRA